MDVNHPVYNVNLKLETIKLESSIFNSSASSSCQLGRPEITFRIQQLLRSVRRFIWIADGEVKLSGMESHLIFSTWKLAGPFIHKYH